MKGKLTTTQTLTARQAIAGGGSTPSGPVTWSQVQNKPFSTVDTEGGLTIYDNTLGIDTLDKIATIEYVNSQIPTVPTDVSAFNNDAGYITDSALEGYATESYVTTAISNIPAPDWSDVQNKPTFATVATSGDYDDLLNKPTIPTVPTDVSAFNNDAGYITDSALTPYVQASALTTVAYSGDYDDLTNKPTIPPATSVTVTQSLSSGTAIGDIDVDGATTTLYAPTPTVIGITNTLATGTTIADIDINGVTTTLYAPAGGGGSQADWTQTDSTANDYIKNKPAVIADTATGSQGRGVILGRFPTATSTGLYAGNNCVAFGYNTYSSNANTQIIADSGTNVGGAIAFGRIDKQTGKIQASNSGSMAFGFVERSGDIKATKAGSLAFGHAAYSVIEATGDGSLSGGYTSSSTSRKTSASGDGAIAFGDGAQATKSSSQAFGFYTSANSAYQMAVGKHNVADSSSVYRFIVGNGTSSSALNNCFAAGADGNIYTAGSLYANVSDWSNPTTSGTKMAIIPEPPTTDGTYTLQATVSNGTITYSWI